MLPKSSAESTSRSNVDLVQHAAANQASTYLVHAGIKRDQGLHPFIGVGYGGFRGDNTSAMLTDKGIDFRQRVPVHRRLKLEVRCPDSVTCSRLRTLVSHVHKLCVRTHRVLHCFSSAHSSLSSGGRMRPKAAALVCSAVHADVVWPPMCINGVELARMQVCGNARLPLPAAQFEHTDGRGELSLGEGAAALHIAQLNPVIYV